MMKRYDVLKTQNKIAEMVPNLGGHLKLFKISCEGFRYTNLRYQTTPKICEIKSKFFKNSITSN